MKYFVSAFTALALMLGSKTLLSAETAKEPSKPVPPAALSENPVLTEVAFHGVTLTDAVAYLRKTLPRFQAVVVPDPECPDPNPELPNIELKNVDLQQLLEVLKKALPQLTIETIGGEKGNVYLFKLATPSVPSPPGMRGVMGGYPGFAPASPSRPEQPQLGVFRLTHLIPADQSDRTKYLNNILSLVQAALEAQGSSSNVLMKVHEPTETLIFRGNSAQTAAVQQVLAALEPTKGEAEHAKLREQMQIERKNMEDSLSRLAKRADEAEADNRDARKRISEQVTEIETLKARLAAKSEKSP